MSRVPLFVAVVLLVFLHAGTVASARRAPLVLPYPIQQGEIPAATYDNDGKRIGVAALSLRETDAGTLAIEVVTGVANGARTEAFAELVLQPDGRTMRILHQRSESFDERGRTLGLLAVDNVRGEGRCGPAHDATGASPVTIPLPDPNQVVNVPLNLLFVPLVKGETERIDFQLFLCRGGPRLMDFHATVSERDASRSSGHKIVEIQYRPQLPPIASWFTNIVTPSLSFWYDTHGEGIYLAHRMPLFSKGPEVMVVRDGIDPALLQ